SNYRSLEANFFSGTIPDELGELGNLTVLRICDNNFNGTIPDFIGDWSWLKKLRITDMIGPSSYFPDLQKSGNMKNLSFFVNCGGQSVTIEGKHYEGDSDAGSGASILYVRDNWGFSSTGDIMDNEGLLGNVYNNLSYLMKLPELYRTARLSPLSITYFGFCLENGNYTVLLHFAEIIFADEGAFNSLGRRLFDIYIQEKLVEKDFNIKDEAKGTGKPLVKQYNVNVTDGTLDIRLYWAGKGTTVIPKRGSYGALISAVSVCHGLISDCAVYGHGKDYKVPLIIGVISCVVILVLSIICWRHYFGDKKAVAKDSFSLRELKTATNNFRPTNKIGEGGFGSVYKGQLSDGTVVAVKVLSSKSKQGNREFVNEIGIISGLRHPNLVKLYGCCTEGNQLMLVYEYMENNSLARALFGYMAPEYALWGHLSNKADVYSFGVVILETVSGKSNSSYKPNNKCVCLLDWAFVAQQRGSMTELVDPILGTEFNREEAERMIKLALLCTNASPSLRPTMSTALSMLEGQTAIEEVISDPGLYGYDLRFKSIRDRYPHVQDSDASGSQSRIRSSFTVSAQDLYPFNPSSIGFSTTDAEDSNSVLLHAS
ncbi:Serine-threonine/tyrosine-protein kinase, catalytic domain, partial [Dillenia turbinata]